MHTFISSLHDAHQICALDPCQEGRTRSKLGSHSLGEMVGSPLSSSCSCLNSFLLPPVGKGSPREKLVSLHPAVWKSHVPLHTRLPGIEGKSPLPSQTLWVLCVCVCVCGSQSLGWKEDGPPPLSRWCIFSFKIVWKWCTLDSSKYVNLNRSQCQTPSNLKTSPLKGDLKILHIC